MKTPTQNRYPYDATILGLDGIYQILYNNSFLVKSDCIASTGNVITVGKEYILFDTSKESGIKMSYINLVDCYYSEGIINLIVLDVRSQRQFTISQCLEGTENDCTNWILVDINYFHVMRDAKAIRDYCGCDDNLKRPNGDSTLNLNEDLLDFEF